MLKETINSSIILLNEEPKIFDNGDGAMRGRFGKVTIKKAPACLVLPDFLPPSDMEDANNNTKPKLELTCFIVGINKKSQEEAEDYCMDKAELVDNRLTEESILVTRGDGSTEYNDWILSNMEWIERKQNGCVLAISFEMELWK